MCYEKGWTMFSDSVDRSRFDCQHTVDGPTDGLGGERIFVVSLLT